MNRPRLILFDEPVAGVNPVLTERIGDLLSELVENGLTLLIVEHNVQFVSAICDKVIVMAGGRLLMQGPGSQIQDDERVLEAFLGGI